MTERSRLDDALATAARFETWGNIKPFGLRDNILVLGQKVRELVAILTRVQRVAGGSAVWIHLNPSLGRLTDADGKVAHSGLYVPQRDLLEALKNQELEDLRSALTAMMEMPAIVPRNHVALVLPVHIAETLLAECDNRGWRRGSRTVGAPGGGWMNVPDNMYQPNFDEAAAIIRNALAKVQP